MKNIKFENNKILEEVPMQEPAIAETQPDSSDISEEKGRKWFRFVKFRGKKGQLKKKEKKKVRKLFLVGIFVFLIIFIGIVILAINYILLPLQRISLSINNIQATAGSILSDFKNKDLSNIDDNIKSIQNELNKINSEIDNYEFLSQLQYTKGYYDNFQIVRGILSKTSDLLETTLPELKNILKVTGFKVEKTITDTGVISPTDTTVAPTEDKGSAVSLIMKELPQYLALYDEIEPKITDILNDVKKINLDYVPNLGGKDLKDSIAKADDFINEFPEISFKTKNFLRNIPNLIGSNSPTTFLVLLQNETEMRSSGGLLTAFGTAQISNGEIGDFSLQDTWNLQYYLWDLVSSGYIYQMPHDNIHGQEFLMNNGCGSTEARVQDSGMYPDLFVSAQWFKDYYDIAHQFDPGGYPAYDYVLLVNNSFAETLISLIQPLTVEGFGDVTADSLYSFIKAQTDNPDNAGDPNRKSIIKEIANAAKDKFLSLPVNELPNVVDAFIKAFEAKDISFASYNDSDMQNYFDTYGLTARTVNDFKGDYFQFNEAQNCALKINKWLRDSVTQNVYIGDDGKIRKDVNIHWTQPKIYDASLEGQYAANLVYSYRAWVRFFLPNSSYNLSSDGINQIEYQFSYLYNYFYYYPLNYYDGTMDKQVIDNIMQFDHRRMSESDSIDKRDLNLEL